MQAGSDVKHYTTWTKQISNEFACKTNIER